MATQPEVVHGVAWSGQPEVVTSGPLGERPVRPASPPHPEPVPDEPEPVPDEPEPEEPEG